MLILFAAYSTSCTKEDPEFHEITYTACGGDNFTVSYYDGSMQEVLVRGCFKVSVMLTDSETADITAYSGESDPFVMAILENDTTRCHIKCGKDQTVNLKWKIE
jgi:hypothetical protein